METLIYIQSIKGISEGKIKTFLIVILIVNLSNIEHIIQNNKTMNLMIYTYVYTFLMYTCLCMPIYKWNEGQDKGQQGGIRIIVFLQGTHTICEMIYCYL